MFNREIIPCAPMLIESMRSLGYSFETAIADLIDNSISAEAKKIEICITPSEEKKMMILDDGYGMTREEIEEAMRYGSRSPLEKRKETDLGRFGLGLKSASLSQCRKLTVISKKNDEISAYSWDLDFVEETGSWMLIGYTEEEIGKFEGIDRFKKQKSGTCLVLENFDRIKEGTANIGETFRQKIVEMTDHISLVFHRYINEGLEIYINNEIVVGRDPFLLNNKKTQYRREKTIYIDDSKIQVKPYILPHIQNLTNEDLKKIGSKEKLKNEQGFYIYRNKRLIIWGTWFRLERKDELNKLARVQVDISSDLDYMWNIDIKKSSANLPDKIKKNLYSAVQDSVYHSENVHTYRGRRENRCNDINYVWERIKSRDGYEYKINRDLPEIKSLEATLDKNQVKLLERMLQNFEEHFPIHALYVDAAKGHMNSEKLEQDNDLLYKEVKEDIIYLKEQNGPYKEMLDAYMKTEPYCLDVKLIMKLEELRENI